MRAGIVIVILGVGLWLMVLGGLPQTTDTSGFTAVGGRDTSLVSGPGTTNGSVEGDAGLDASEAATPEPTPTPIPEVTPETESEEPASDGSVYVVQRGDTMARIAQAHGVSLQALIAANPQISDPTRIEIGQEINIPD